jgi:CheY-like chemotaxis protein
MANVLIVDDSDDTRRLLCAFLTRAGHRTRAAAGVTAAMELIADELPDLIITDLMMPYESGYDLLRMLRANSRTRAIPAIVYSAVNESGYVEQAMETGATDYWLKGSITGPDLSNRLRPYLPAQEWSESPTAHQRNNFHAG